MVLRIASFHIFCIILFAIIYWSLGENFYDTLAKIPDPIDYILMSSTIQSGVGLTVLNPITKTGKYIICLQQFILILANVFTVYIFTL